MSLILVEPVHNGVATITLNRPDRRNALSRELLGALSKALSGLSKSPDLRVLILTGADPAFCAGVDLDDLGRDPTAYGVQDLAALRAFEVPVIGAINGATVTGGLEVALACDFRIASERARFADTHALVGGMPAWGLTARLPQAVGQGWARQLSFTGEFLDAATAQRIGLVNEVVAHEQLLPRARALAAAIVATAEPAMSRIRASYDRGRDQTGADSLAMESALDGQLLNSHEDFLARRQEVLSRPL